MLFGRRRQRKSRRQETTPTDGSTPMARVACSVTPKAGPSSTSRTRGFPHWRRGSRPLVMKRVTLRTMLPASSMRAKTLRRRRAKDCGARSPVHSSGGADEFGGGVERQLWRIEAALHGSRGKEPRRQFPRRLSELPQEHVEILLP